MLSQFNVLLSTNRTELRRCYRIVVRALRRDSATDRIHAQEAVGVEGHQDEFARGRFDPLEGLSAAPGRPASPSRRTRADTIGFNAGTEYRSEIKVLFVLRGSPYETFQVRFGKTLASEINAEAVHAHPGAVGLPSPYERKEDVIPVLICPECKTSNPDNAASCESCSTAFGLDSPIAAEGQNDQRTEVAAPVSSPFSSPLSGAAAARGFAGLAAGDVIAARYEIIAGIGQGGMGSVYKALDRELDRVIALKTIRPDLASNASVLRRFKQEILLARQISHRNVIRIFDFGVANGVRFITMEFVDGEDLKSRLRRHGKLAPDESVAVMRQICEGLQAAHTEDVIHRDLKPENILIDQQNHARIMDFAGNPRLYVPGTSARGSRGCALRHLRCRTYFL